MFLLAVDTPLTDRLIEHLVPYIGADPEAVDKSSFTASSVDCAWAIMRGTTLRHREIYFPPEQYIKYLVWFRDIILKLDIAVMKSEELHKDESE